MNKNMLKLIVPIFTILLLASMASASYYYDDNYKKEYTVKETYDKYGYTFYEKNAQKDPWGEKTTYTKVKDYNTGYYNDYNKLYDYWSDGPYKGYSKTYKTVETRNDDTRYLGYGWDDAYRRTVYDSQYHPYYYEPRYFYDGTTYDWSSKNEPRCGNTARCNKVSYCGSSFSYCSW